ncbi:Vacuolar sorting protein 9, partial [Globisporangium polare]
MTKNALALKPLSGLALAVVARASNQLEAAVTTMPSGAVLIGSVDGMAAVASNGDPLIASSSLTDEKHQASVVMSVATSTEEEFVQSDNKENAAPVVSLAMSALDKSEELHCDDSASQDTVGADDATGGSASTVKNTAATRPASFVARMVRELSRKRALNVEIAKTQLEMKCMQSLMGGYQVEVQRVLTQLNSEALALEDACVRITQSVAAAVTRLLTEGWCRQLVDTYRSLQLLLLQENKLQRARVALRRSILQTRDEECDWMGSAIAGGYQRQVRRLVSQLSGASNSSSSDGEPLLECDDHVVQQQHSLSADDPFFANPEHLHKASAQSKQLELQLNSIAKLIVTMRAKVQELVVKQNGESRELQWLLTAPAATPAPATTVVPSILKRNSLKEKAISRRSSSVGDSTSVAPEKQKQLRRILSEVAKLTDVPRAGGGGGGARYNACLNEFGRVVSDQRTRVGRLSAGFAKKLAEDTRVEVEILTTVTTEQSAAQRFGGESEAVEAAADSGDDDGYVEGERDTDNLYVPDLQFFVRTANSSSWRQIEPDEPRMQSSSTAAVVVGRLPPPIWILAFARFLQRLIVSEYALDEPSSTEQQSDLDGAIQSAEDDRQTHLSLGVTETDLNGLDRPVSERALEVCVHYFVISKLSSLCCAYEQSRFCEDVDPTTSHAFLQQQHWQHAKEAIQRISWEQLAFPNDVAEIIRRHLDTNASNSHHSSSFLPQTLHAFKSVECETTPNGVVRAVMNAFTVLHRELDQLLR